MFVDDLADTLLAYFSIQLTNTNYREVASAVTGLTNQLQPALEFSRLKTYKSAIADWKKASSYGP